MTGAEYRESLDYLNLSHQAAGRMLGVSRRTAQVFAKEGPTPPAALAIKLLIMLAGIGPQYLAAAIKVCAQV